MSLTINIYYIGKNGNAKKFVNEMISTGIVDMIRNEEGMANMRNLGENMAYLLKKIKE